MPANPTIESAIPDAGVASSFTHGEMALSVSSPMSATPGNSSFYLSRMFRLASGTYMVKIDGSDPCTLWVGPDLLSTHRVVALTPGAAAPTQAQFFVREGDHRFDLVLTNFGTAPNPAYVVFSLWKDGKLVYASNASNWLWDTAYLPDSALAALPDVRLSLPVFTLTPNWSSGVTERLTFKTEILSSEKVVEQRRSMLRHPKRSIEASFLRHGEDRIRFDNFVSGIGTADCMVPFWPEQLRTSGALVSGATQFDLPKDTLIRREFFTDDAVLIMRADAGDYEVAIIESIVLTEYADELHFAAPIAKTWPTGFRITPLHRAKFDTLPSLTNITDRVAQAQARFEFKDTLKTIVPSWAYCAPLWRFKVDRAERVANSYDRMDFVIDNDRGAVDVVDFGGRTEVSVKVGLKLFGRSTLSQFRAFISMARGKAVRFWFPSGTHDVEFDGTISGMQIDVTSLGYADWMRQPQDARLMLGFVLNNGSPTIYRRIESAVKLPGATDRFTLDKPLPVLSRSIVSRISFILPVRFDQDVFELHHVTDSAKVVQAAVVVRSASIDGMPDIDCWVTSKPYPVLVEEEVSVSARLTGGRFNDGVGILDEVALLAQPVGGTLQTLLASTDVGFDEIAVISGVVGGTIADALESFDAGFDSATVSAKPVGGTIQSILITYSLLDEPDTLSVASKPTGGTLV